MKLFLKLLLLCTFLLPQVNTTAYAQSTIDTVIERGVLRVGFSTFVPWAMQDKNGEYIGFEIDVAKKLAQDLGVELQLIPTNWDGIIPALLAKKFDVIIGGMGSTTKRNLTVNFTIPYDYVYMDIVANKETASHIKSPEDVNKKETIITVRNGSSAAYYVKTRYPNATVRTFNDEAPALQEVLLGRANVFVSARPLPTLEIAKNPEKLYRPFEITDYREPIGFAVRKGDIDTLNIFNNWIYNANSLGWLKERSDYWFMSTKWKNQLLQK